MTRSQLFDFALERWGIEPDRPFRGYPDVEVLRHADSGKWFAIVMPVSAEKLGLAERTRGEELDVVNLKLQPPLVTMTLEKEGAFPAYHMNRKHWVSIVLDSAFPPEELFELTSVPAESVTPPISSIPSGDLTFADNGAPSQTVIASSAGAYTVVGNTYIKNTSSRTLDSSALAANTHQSKLTGKGPQVLIIHSHGSEAYTMPAGQEYTASGTYRTHDTNYNVVRIGDEIASVLSEYGISVLHDRTLHDVPSYDNAYNSSLASIEEYLAKYPTLVYVLDIHRDAITASDGAQYKLISQEDSRAAQCCFVMGMVSDRWAENMSLAIAVQETLVAHDPTLMRPIAARGYRYNQHLPIDSLLVEVGAAGNSLDEALFSARIFAKCFAETLLPS